MKSRENDGLLDGRPEGSGAWCCAAVRERVQSMPWGGAGIPAMYGMDVLRVSFAQERSLRLDTAHGDRHNQSPSHGHTIVSPGEDVLVVVGAAAAAVSVDRMTMTMVTGLVGGWDRGVAAEGDDQ